MFLDEEFVKSIECYKQAITGAEKEKLISDAEEAMNGIMTLPGTAGKKVFVGNPPKWKENPYGVGGYSWELSRMMYLETLCRAYIVTKNITYIHKVYDDLYNWMDTVEIPGEITDEESLLPYKDDSNWRMLEIGHRMEVTFRVILPVTEWAGASPEWLERMKRLVVDHGERLYAGAHLLWPNYDHNHYMTEITGLLSCCYYLKNTPYKEKWIDRALDGFEKACLAQISEDGAQIEGAVSYHNYTMRAVLNGVLAIRKLGYAISENVMDRIRDGINYSLQMVRPNGELVPFGDSKQETSIENAVCGYLLFEEINWLSMIRRTASENEIRKTAAEAGWSYPDIDKLFYLLKEPCRMLEEPALPLINFQRAVQQVCIRTSWKTDALCLAMTCKTPVHYGNHGHIDPLGIDFSAYGKALLIDPGCIDYKEGEIRHMYKSSAFHNMPTVEGRDAFKYIHTFGYGKQEKGEIYKIFDTLHMKGVSGYHLNYNPVRLERFAAIIDQSFLLLTDTFINGKGKIGRIFHHFNAEKLILDHGIVRTEEEGVNIALFSSVTDKIELLDGRSYSYKKTMRAAYSVDLQKEREVVVTLGIPYVKGKTRSADCLKIDDKQISFRVDGKTYRLPLDENGLMEV
ncbi:MAG: heparinase II/III family protein [Clostridiaceae bacterium]|nr:heparinase II/III family protein [Clostridiaceae bacterium]